METPAHPWANLPRGCCNPVCPQANWANVRLPHWQIVVGQHHLGVVMACDLTCATVGGKMLAARQGYPPDALIVQST